MSMKTSRSALSVNVIDGKLYAMVSSAMSCSEISLKNVKFFQGGYDGTHFLANVEVYDPVKDEWEDGIPLTSGRSGLASAVIYQPSCPQSYSQDCLTNLSSNREYDDDRKPPDGHDDDADISSQGAGPSYHLSCSSNFFSGGRAGSNFDDSEINWDGIKERLSSEMFKVLTEMRDKLNDHCTKNEPCQESRNQLQQQLNENNFANIARFQIKCNKHSTCPLTMLKRKFQHFLFNRKGRNRK